MANSDAGDVLLAFLVGALAGTVFGLLYAPRPGKETRERLKVLSDDIADKIRTMSDEMKDRAEDVVYEAKDKLHEAKDKIMSQKDKIEEAFEGGRKAHNSKST